MISFIIPLDHIIRHFPGSDDIGSVFFAKTPMEVLTKAATRFPQVFKEAKTDADKRIRLSFSFDEEVGVCNVVDVAVLTPEEVLTIREDERDGCIVKTATSNRIFPTKEFQLILEADHTIVTMFPGPMAPPLPKKGEVSDFWDRHVFIKPIHEIS